MKQIASNLNVENTRLSLILIIDHTFHCHSSLPGLTLSKPGWSGSLRLWLPCISAIILIKTALAGWLQSKWFDLKGHIMTFHENKIDL
jgi:hypothetical protein